MIQVFEGSENMSLVNTHTETYRTSDGNRTFQGYAWDEPLTASDSPLMIWGRSCPRTKQDVNGLPLNPVRREYPRNYIRTGISAIDGLTTLIRGQKLPIFSGNGLPHDQLAAQIVKAGVPWGRFGRRVCHRVCGHGCQT